MEIKKRLITLMLAASIGVGVATMAGCNDKREEEINSENEIRKMLQYDANINIGKNDVEYRGFKFDFKISETGGYLIIISNLHTEGYNKFTDEITYSVDKDFYYNFKEEYSTKETQKEVDLIKELTTKYDPIKVVEDNVEKDITNNLE